MTDDRETFIDLLNRSGVDYNASEKDAVVVETDQPNVFVQLRFGDPGPLQAVEIVDWNEMRRA